MLSYNRILYLISKALKGLTTFTTGTPIEYTRKYPGEGKLH